jgi:hypothetical protein
MNEFQPDAEKPSDAEASAQSGDDLEVQVEYAALLLSGGPMLRPGEFGTVPGAVADDLWEWGVCYVRAATDADEGREQLLDAFRNYVDQGGFIDAADLRDQESVASDAEAHPALSPLTDPATDGTTGPPAEGTSPGPAVGDDSLGSVLFGTKVALNLALDSTEQTRGEILVALEDVEHTLGKLKTAGPTTSSTTPPSS